MMNRKAELIGAIGPRLARYMEEGNFKSAAFTLHFADPDPLGIKVLGQVPAAWFEEVKVPGYVVERVGRNSIRIW